jgi:hypothetical protein
MPDTRGDQRQSDDPAAREERRRAESRSIRAVEWAEVFPSLLLFRTFRFSRFPGKLILASTATLMTAVVWWILGEIFSGSQDAEIGVARVERFSAWPWESKNDLGLGPQLVETLDRFRGAEAPSSSLADWLVRDPFIGTWHELSRPFWDLFNQRYTYVGFAYVLLGCLATSAIWSVFGGAITRIAALELSQDRRLGLGAALRFAASRWTSYFGAVWFPFVGIVVGLAAISTVGWLLRFDWGFIVLACLFPFLLGIGLLLTITIFVLIAGWPMMWVTISAEGTDAFDALSRTYSYVVDRPLHFLGYSILAAVQGVFGWTVVAAFTALIVFLTTWCVSWTAGGERTNQVLSAVAQHSSDVMTFDAPPVERSLDLSRPAAVAGVWLLLTVLAIVKLVAGGFAYSYFCTANTAIYFLLRREVDGMEMDEVFLEDQGEEFGLPRLRTDAEGVPEVDEGPAGAGG